MNDDVVFQRGSPLPEGETNPPPDAGSPSDSPLGNGESHLASPKIFDFSSDLNISAVSDETVSNGETANAGIAPGQRIYIQKVPPRTNLPPKVKPPVVQTKPVQPPQPAKQTTPVQQWQPEPKPEPQPPQSDFQTNFAPPPSTFSPPPPVPFSPKPTPKVQVINTIKEPVMPKPGAPALNKLSETIPTNLPGATEMAANTPPTPAPEIKLAKIVEKSKLPETPPLQEFSSITERAPEKPEPASWKPKPMAPTPVPDKVDIKNLRTFEGDIAEALSHRGNKPTQVSQVSMAIAESKRRGEGETIRNIPEPVTPISRDREVMMEETPGAPRHSGKKLIFAIVSILLILGGCIAGYFLYSISPLASTKGPVRTNSRTLPSIIPSDIQAIVKTDGLNETRLIETIGDEVRKKEKDGIIKEIVMIEDKGGEDFRLSTLEMSAMVGINIPDIIARTLMPHWMLGTYSDMTGPHMFVAVTTNLFQNAFAGMLQWEDNILGDIAKIVPLSAQSASFKDKIVRNKDVRVFVTQKGETLFLYSFIDNATLVFADNETTLNAILGRLESKAFVR